MYAIATNKNNTNTKVKKGGGKFCKVCKDVGKTLDEYTSHYVRETLNPTSRVVCPTLNAAVCRYCKTTGHTVKHCPKTKTKNLLHTRTKEVNILSKNYCQPATTKKTSNVIASAFSVLSEDSSDEEDEVVVTPPPPCNGYPASYASVLRNTPHINNILLPPQGDTPLPSQVESLIPVKLNFSGDNVVTLYNITKRWADEEEEEDLDERDILYTTNIVPPPFSANHTLTRFVSFVDALARDYTCGFSKSIAITSDAFQQLSKNWETDFFNTDGDRNALDGSHATNVRARSFLMTDRYIK